MCVQLKLRKESWYDQAECSTMIWKIPEDHCGIFLNTVKCCGMFWNNVDYLKPFLYGYPLEGVYKTKIRRGFERQFLTSEVQ